MIRKSGNRFCDNIMHTDKLTSGAHMFRILAVAAALVIAGPAFAQNLPAGVDPQNAVLIDTKHGRIVIKLRPDLAPKHAERIRTLSREGFYNNAPFHRVIDGFMAQTGDGARGDGTGKSKYPDLPAEFTGTPFERGIVGMARSQNPNSANAQFFIMFAPASHLNNQYTVVGEVVSGMDVVDKLKKGPPERNGAVTDPDRIVKMSVAR
jgi:peptidylprolyl isomerase